MSSEDLAPTALKNRRIERQNKYFKEQVLMHDEAKVIAKTHKGESVLTVNKDNNQEENFFNLSNDLLSFKKEREAKQGEQSDRASWDLGSETEEAKEPALNGANETGKLSRMVSSSSVHSKPSKPARQSSGKIVETRKAVTSMKPMEIKYKNLNHEQINLYNLLEEYKSQNLVQRFNEKLKSHLKESTIKEITDMRKSV